MIIAIVLSLLIGLTLGLLGGGGSILTVPVLIYALGMAEKSAIATSLFVVAVTSAVAAVQHALAGHVRWRIALMFGGAGMLGAFAGGSVAQFLPAWILLTGFAIIMLATGLAMWRKSSVVKPVDEAEETEAPLHSFKILAEGLLVGVVTGLVGAGGGFLVVPALVLLGRLKMRDAVGTSLVVIALKSTAGLAGYAGHVTIDWPLAFLVTAVAVAGSFIGMALSRRVNPESLRRVFAGFVLVMAVGMLVMELPEGVRSMLLTQPWPFWVGGLAIGLFVLFFLLGGGKLLGVSTGYQDACMAPFERDAKRSWRLPFIGGIVLGGTVAAITAGSFHPSFAMGMFDVVLSSSLIVKALVFTAGGILLGFGARMAGGCTSGHSIVGVAQLAPSSLVATGAFMAAGFAVTNLLYRGLAG